MGGRTLVTNLAYSSALNGDTVWFLMVPGLVLPGSCHCLSLGGAFERQGADHICVSKCTCLSLHDAA